MEVVAILLIATALGVVWFSIARSLKRKSVNFILRHILGATVGCFAMVVLAVIFVATGLIDSDQSSQQEPVVAAAENSSAESAPTSAKVAQTTRSTPVEEKPQELAQEPEEADLGFTSSQFAANFNKAMDPFDLPFKAPANLAAKAGAVNDVFTLMLNDNIAVTGTVNKQSGMIKSLLLMGTGDGTAESGARVMLTALAMFVAARGDFSKEGNDAARETLTTLFEKQDAAEDRQARTYRSGIAYSIASPEGMGTWFTVSREN